MFDVEKAGEEYNYFMDHFGSPPPISFGLFDRRVLIPRPEVPEWVERDSGERVSVEHLDLLEGDGVFSWLHGAGDGRDLGVPMYVPYRIGLCLRLLRERWTIQEIRELAEWEEWVVADMVESDLPYEDDDRLIVLCEFKERLEMLEIERIRRLPADERPANWTERGWTSEICEMIDEELPANLSDARSMVRRLEAMNLETVSTRIRREVGRRAYQLGTHYERVRLLAVVSDRTEYEAGFSPHVCLDGPRSLIGDVNHLESFGQVNWHQTLKSWRILEDPDNAPVRLPGFVCVGGTIQMPNALTPAQYSERFALFRLDEYALAFEGIISNRRCRHCEKSLPKNANERRVYCNSRCSHAYRQKQHRVRAKEAILRRRGQ